MEFRVLGPLEVHVDGQRMETGSPRVRCVLALLLAQANQLVSVDQFVDELWTEPPGEARQLVHGYLSRLRRVLRAGGAAAAARVVTHRPGYYLVVEDHELDVWRFERLVHRAHREPANCLRLLREAQREWRGRAYADVPKTLTLQAETARLEEYRLRTLEEQFDLELATEAPEQLVPELTRLVAAEPMRGKLVLQLMVALHRSARTADALGIYLRTKQKLADELGLDPPNELQRLYLAILHNQPEPAASWHAEPDRGQARPAGPTEPPRRSGSGHYRPAHNLKRQYLTDRPAPEVNEVTVIEREIWLTDGPYTGWQLMGDAEDRAAAAWQLRAGTYAWTDRLVPDNAGRYRQETALTPLDGAGSPVSWSGWWQVSAAGLYTWGSRLDPEF